MTASRKLIRELGISVPTQDFQYIARVRYLEQSTDPKWGESESAFACSLDVTERT